MKFSLFLLISIHVIVLCSAKDQNAVSTKNDGVAFVGRMIEQGRTLVHHAMKRFMILLPAIFFKLGIGFTLLVLVTIVAVNNGFIGFLLLVVGLSSVLARLQEARKPPAAAVPYISPLPHPYYHHTLLDRSDTAADKTSVIADSLMQATPSYQYYANYKPYAGYGQYNYYSAKV